MKVLKSFKYSFILIGLFILSCAPEEGSHTVQELDKKEVVKHTSGIISAGSPVFIQFVKEMVDEADVDKPLKEPLIVFTPEVKGVSSWADTRTLEFRPDSQMKSGESYIATVYIPQNNDIPGSNFIYKFEFEIIKQAFEITVDGLRSEKSETPSLLQLDGRIMTADGADPFDIEAMVEADQMGQALSLDWEHSPDKKEHKFFVKGIQRKGKTSQLMLKWDGKTINVPAKGQRAISIPADDKFAILQSRAVQDKTHYIEIYFSDPLDTTQNLQGLVDVQRGESGTISDLRFSIEQNILKIFNPANWTGDFKVRISPGIKNIKGHALKTAFESTVFFEEPKPLVRFAGKGVILPTTWGLNIPIETINLEALRVEALQIPENNFLQFLQINDLDGNTQLRRVSPIIWKKTVLLPDDMVKKDQWIRYGLDISSLVKNHPGGMYRLQLSFKKEHILYDCPKAKEDLEEYYEEDIQANEYDTESSNWDTYDDYYNSGKWKYYEERYNPCSPGYYEEFYDHDVQVARNFLISDIGLIAKKGFNKDLFIAVNDIKTTEPLQDADITVYDYQQQIITTGKSDAQGLAILSCERDPYFIVTRHGKQKGYLKVNDGSALPVSHFDVSGSKVNKGLKGYIYCDRGVWRPGDEIYLTFILMDMGNRLPKDHPISLELQNPRGQIVGRWKKTLSQNRFHSFKLKTDKDAPTGNWTARIKVGGAIFEKILLVKTVMPNRLKIDLDFGEGVESLAGKTLRGTLSSTWLHGATAKGLKADVKLLLMPKKTIFKGFSDYSFDDPVRRYEPETQDIFEGKLNSKGTANIESEIQAKHHSPGMLNARFTTRVFEPGGAFSIDRYDIPYHPYKQYVGIRVPKGDEARNMLLTDTNHRVSIVMIDPDGALVKEGDVEVELYKIKWRWWWEKGEDNIADYLGKSSFRAIKREKVFIRNGKGEWNFEVNYPDWGRYLIKAKDESGNHVTGSIVYIDWPGWAGRAMKDTPGGATVLSFSTDREEYKVGDKVVLSIPTGHKGRGLLSLETGSRILRTEWFMGTGETTRLEFTATEDMAPTVYVHATFLQPHLQTGNDLPIRMYGIIPVKVLDPKTRLEPKIDAPDVLIPESTSVIKIYEASGKPMTYTIAVVDDGLLDLTRFKTPDPWDHFYKREALGVKTWDLYGEVAGAYGGILESILTIGGDDFLANKGERKADRFPPMVVFLGPFDIEKDTTAEHEIPIPQYFGSARIMVVAGHEGAYGSAQKNVYIRKPLMILGTLPRVLGPKEDVALPVSVFALEKKVRDVEVKVNVNELLTVRDDDSKKIRFSDTGDDLVSFRLKAGEKSGIASVSIIASSDNEKARQDIELDVKNPGEPVTDILSSDLSPGETWEQDVDLPGISGTNSALLEVSRIPPINLGHRLDYLIKYPYGCLEQVISSLFPQIFLGNLIELPQEKEDKIQSNIKAGINKIKRFQSADGGFFYWPSYPNEDEWVSSYTGHFLLEAQLAGFTIPSGLLDGWKNYQKKYSRNWVTGTTARSQLIQAYRLYTLALANDPDLAGMNRLRTVNKLSDPVKWRLAAAYQLAGQPEAAQELIRNAGVRVGEYQELSNTYGSNIRDEAMILESISLFSEMENADSIIRRISDELSSDRYMSTQTTAFALLAMAKAAGIFGNGHPITFDFKWNQEDVVPIQFSSPLLQKEISIGNSTTAKLFLKNKGNGTIYSRLILKGIPAMGEEKEARNGLLIQRRFLNLEGDHMDYRYIPQGTDLIAEITVANTGARGIYDNVALTQIFPSGWEIIDPDFRMADNDNSPFDFQDIKDDRVYTYFNIEQSKRKTFNILLNATYVGRFYLPGARAQAMYDETINGRLAGEWISVINAGE